MEVKAQIGHSRKRAVSFRTHRWHRRSWSAYILFVPRELPVIATRTVRPSSGHHVSLESIHELWRQNARESQREREPRYECRHQVAGRRSRDQVQSIVAADFQNKWYQKIICYTLRGLLSGTRVLIILPWPEGMLRHVRRMPRVRAKISHSDHSKLGHSGNSAWRHMGVFPSC